MRRSWASRAVVAEPRGPIRMTRSLTVVELLFLTVLDPPATLREIKEIAQVRRLGAGPPKPALHNGGSAEAFVQWMRETISKV